MDDSFDTLAALDAIRKAVEKLPGGRSSPRVDPTKVLSDPTKAVRPADDRPGVGGRLAAGGGAILGAINATFGAVLPPLNLLANTLGAANSGLSLVTKTLGIMGAVLAPIILPFMFLFAAAILYAATAIQKHLWPALEKIWKELGPALGDAFRTLIDITGRLVTGLGNFLRAIGVVKDDKPDPGQQRLNARNTAKTNADEKTEQKYPLKRPGEETDAQRAERVRQLEAELADLNKRGWISRPGETTPDLTHPEEAYKKALRDRLEELKKPTPEPADARDAAERAKREAYRDTNPPIADKFEREDARWKAGEKAGEEAWKKWHADRGQPVPEMPPGLSRTGPQAAAPAKPAPGQPGGGQPPNPAAGGLAGMTGMFDALLKSFEMSLGPKASFGGIGVEQAQAAQLALFNVDPLEQIQMQFYRDTLPLLRTIVASLDKPTHGK